MNKKSLLKEQMVLGELSPSAILPWNKVEQAAMTQEIHTSNQEILSTYPPEFMMARFKKAAGDTIAPAPESKKGKFTLLTWAPLAAAAVLALFFLPWNALNTDTQGERLKGGEPRFSVFRQTGDEPQLLGNQAPAHQGDRLQLSITVFKKTYGALFSLDGRGMITVHYPAKGTFSESLEPGEFVLPYSYILDDAPDFENFFFVTADQMFEISKVTAQIKNGELKAGGPGVKVSSLTLRKEK